MDVFLQNGLSSLACLRGPSKSIATLCSPSVPQLRQKTLTRCAQTGQATPRISVHDWAISDFDRCSRLSCFTSVLFPENLSAPARFPARLFIQISMNLYGGNTHHPHAQASSPAAFGSQLRYWPQGGPKGYWPQGSVPWDPTKFPVNLPTALARQTCSPTRKRVHSITCAAATKCGQIAAKALFKNHLRRRMTARRNSRPNYTTPRSGPAHFRMRATGSPPHEVDTKMPSRGYSLRSRASQQP